jgi:N-acetylneuraminic acid mutarotase
MPAGATLNFATLGTQHLNIAVNTSPATVGSVGFNYDGNATYHIENAAPYDIGGDTNGVYAAWTPALGTHTLIVTPYTGSNLSGTAGTSLTETFTVTNSATTTESPFLGTPFAVPGTIMLDNFDNGGQGVAYNDTTPGNQGGSYRSTDVDIEPATDVTPPGLTSSSPGVGFDVGHIVASEWLKYTINVATAGTYAFDVRIASGGPGGTFHIESDGVNVTGSMALSNTGGWQTWQTVTASNISLTAGQHILRLVFDTTNGGELGNVGYLDIRSLATTPPAETPFLGTPFALPGTIMLDNFDNGGEGVAYSDTTPGNQGGSYRSTDVDIEPSTDSTPPGLMSTSPGVGFDVGSIQASEWLNYTVSVATAGTYDLEVRVASEISGGTFHFAFDGVNATGAMTMPNTGGWQAWTTLTSGNFTLAAGQHIMRLMFDTSTAYAIGNVEYVVVQSVATTPPPPPAETPFEGSPFAVPGTIMLDNFDNGGEGVAYNDTTPGNQGGSYRNTDVDIEPATDVTPPGLTATTMGVGYNIGHIQAGEWLNYTVNIASFGAYNIGVRVASEQGGSFHISIDGTNVTGPMTLPNTGGWQTWQTVTASGVTLPAGQHILQIMFDSSGYSEFGNVEYLQITSAAGSITTSTVTWPSITPSPIAREEGQSITINNLLYAFGGFDDAQDDSSTRSDVYNIATNTWTQLANMPENLTHGGTIYDSVNNNIWLVGGFVGPENAPGVNHVWIYSITNNSWSAGPSLPSGVGAAAVVLVGRNIHVISGLTETPSDTFVNTTEHWVLNLDNQSAGWTNAAPIPTPRNHAGYVTLNGLIYVIGGQDALNETEGNMTAVEAYNPATDTWATEAPLPAGRGHIMNSTLVRNGQILVIGGETDGNPFRSDVLVYDPPSNTWTTLSNVVLPQGRKCPVAGLFGDLLVVFGGQNPNPDPDGWETTLSPSWSIGAPLPVSLGETASGVIGTKLYVVGQESSTTYVYDLVAGTWSTAAPRPFVGDHHAAEVFNGELYLIGGLDNGSPGQVQIYNPATNTWSLGAPMPWPGGSVSTALINGKVYAAGGIINSTTTTNQAAVYDPVANTWTAIASMPVGVNHTAASTDGTNLYIFGGRTGGNVLTDGFNYVQIYNPTTNTWTSSTSPGSTIAPLPQARGGMGKAVYFNGEFYVLGGETADPTVPNGVYNRVDIYNPTTNTWRLGIPMPVAHHGIFPVLYNNQIYVAGGGVHSDDSNSVILEILSV